MSAIEMYLYWQVNLVAFRVHSRVKPLMTFQCQTTLCVVLELAKKEEAYNSVVYKKVNIYFLEIVQIIQK